MKTELQYWMNGVSKWNRVVYGAGLIAGLYLAVAGSELWEHALGVIITVVNSYGLFTLATPCGSTHG